MSSQHFLFEENNKSLLISVPNISTLKMNGSILICTIDYNRNNTIYSKLLKIYTFLENKGERSLVIPQYFPECFISKRVGKKPFVLKKRLEVIIINYKKDMIENILLIL